MTTPRVLVIIPAFNEEKTIENILLKLRDAAPDIDRIVVNDGSQDMTAQFIQDLGEKQLRLTTNLGYGAALQTGMKFALQHGYDIIVSLDADGQHRPEDVTLMIETLSDNNADMVIGSRFYNGHLYDTPIDRRIGQLLFSYLTRLFVGKRIYDTSSGFKAMKASACENIVHMNFMDFHIETLVRLSMLGLKIIEYPIIVNERVAGRSMHSLSSIFSYPIKTLLLTLITAFDVILTRRWR